MNKVIKINIKQREDYISKFNDGIHYEIYEKLGYIDIQNLAKRIKALSAFCGSELHNPLIIVMILKIK